MKTIALFLSLLGFTSATTGIIELDEVKSMHKEWMSKHAKSYSSVEEEALRFNVFAANLEKILEHNVKFSMGKSSFTMSMNGHGDLSFEEWSASKLSFKPSPKLTNLFPSFSLFTDHHSGVHTAPLIRGIEAPTTVDWRAKGAVTPVKDQGQCGSCWSFSATGSMEGAHFLKTGQLVSLSEEQLINCVNSGSYDCNSGGDMIEAFKYVISNKGIVSEDSNPYETKDHETCTYKAGVGTYAATFSSFKTVTSNDEVALASAVAITPVSVAIDASQQSFQFYSSGVYDEPSCCTNCQQSDLDHGVLAVGYGTDNGSDYWLIKNSWNSGWGDAGYIKMKRGNGQCGVATYASYPVV